MVSEALQEKNQKILTPAHQAAIEAGLRAARDAGVPAVQLDNFLRAGVVLQPRQWAACAAARMCDVPKGPTEIAYGGARGGGKSHWMLAQMAVDDCQRQPELQCLILRKVGKALKEAVHALRRRILPKVPHVYKEAAQTIEFPNGSWIKIGHFQNEKDVDGYLGLEYDLIGIEEATTLSASKVKNIRTCLRTSKPDWRPRMYLTTNPGGIGHAWFKKRYVEPFRVHRERKTRFVPATVKDNAFVNQEYQGTLGELTGWQRKAWLEGDWDIAAGQFFTTWRRDVHVRPEIEIDESWLTWLALDYGFTHWNVCYLMAEDGDGNILVVDEWAAQKTLVPGHCEGIRAMMQRHNVPPERIWRFVAGGDVFSKKQNGRTIADDYRDEGFKLKRAYDDRINGAAAVLSRLGDIDALDGDGNPKPISPRLFIAERCRLLIDCMPELQHDPNFPEKVLKWDTDEDGQGGDDPYDALRYGLMARYAKRLRSWGIPGDATVDEEAEDLPEDAPDGKGWAARESLLTTEAASPARRRPSWAQDAEPEREGTEEDWDFD